MNFFKFAVWQESLLFSWFFISFLKFCLILQDCSILQRKKEFPLGSSELETWFSSQQDFFLWFSLYLHFGLVWNPMHPTLWEPLDWHSFVDCSRIYFSNFVSSKLSDLELLLLLLLDPNLQRKPKRLLLKTFLIFQKLTKILGSKLWTVKLNKSKPFIKHKNI